MPCPGIAAVLLDVGGTLWPDNAVSPARAGALRRERLARAFPGLPAALLLELEARVADAFAALEGALLQDTDALLRAAWGRLPVSAGAAETDALRRALCLPAAEIHPLFAGARELLAEVRALGLRCVIVSNAAVRDAAAYRADLAAFGVAGLVDVVVSSVDLGVRKPHPAFFDAALAAAGCPARVCVMVGNSERNDIAPAVALGMRALRVAIEEPPPPSTAADAVCTDLARVAEWLRTWAALR
jgi:FMN phosphatase YigB (HAD superfamily)